MKAYFRGGKLQDWERELDNGMWQTRADAPSITNVGIFKFKLLPVEALNGGLIYDCINENAEECYNCNGEGEHDCGYCDGTGRVDCDDCDAMGFIESDEELTKRKKREDREAKEKAEQEKRQIPMEF